MGARMLIKPLRYKSLILFASSLVIVFSTKMTFAQDTNDLPELSNASEPTSSEENQNMDLIEAEIDKSALKKRKVEGKNIPEEKEEKIENLTGLSKIQPFSEVSVIQKRFMPKTQRFQVFGGLAYMTNDPWFLSLGFNGKFAYHLTEQWGVELTAMMLSTSQKQSIKDLHDNNGVQTSALLTPKSYFGADVLWSPIYGKMSLFNKRIVPFDMYFAFGGGSTTPESGTVGGTMHFGTGQIFSLSKSMGLRWDVSWNTYSGKPTADSTNTNPSPQSFNNLLLSVGASFFFPEVKYR